MSKKKFIKPETVLVSEACDGFRIIFFDENGTEKSFSFSQEDEDKKELVTMFKWLGYNVSYHEDW